MPINSSKPRRVFKDMLGHSNHYLVTILVGLHSVAETTTAVPAELRAAWSPRDPVESARRSRPFALAAALAWAVDAVDAYLSLALRKPSIVERPGLRLTMEAAGQSVSRKLDAAREAYPQCAGTASAMVALSVIWRNRLVHSMADNEVPEDLRSQLNRAGAEIENNYRGLNIERTLAAVNKSQRPTLKETASMLAACHAFVENIDALLLADLSMERYLADVLAAHFGGSVGSVPWERMVVLWGKETSRRKRSITQSVQNEASVAMPDPVVENWVDSLAASTFRAARSQLLR